MRKILVIFFLVIISVRGFSQAHDPVKWEFKVIMLGGCEAELIFTATVDSGWHLYSQKFEMNPLFFEFTKPIGYSIVGNVSEPGSVKEYDDLLKTDTYYFKESRVVFKQKIKITSKDWIMVPGKVYGQVCQYHEGVCMMIDRIFHLIN